MRRSAYLCLFLSLLIAPAWAQFTTVSGTVTDPSGLPYANGTIVPSISASTTPTLNGAAYLPPSGPVSLDGNGSFTMNLASQASLSPAGTTWSFTVCSGAGTVQPAIGTGPVCFSITGVVIAGATQSLSTTLSAAAPALTKLPSTSGTVPFTWNTITCAALNAATTPNFPCANTRNTFIVNSAGSTLTTLTHGLSIYYEGDAHNTGTGVSNTLSGLDVVESTLVDAGSLNKQTEGINLRINATGAGTISAMYPLRASYNLGAGVTLSDHLSAFRIQTPTVAGVVTGDLFGIEGDAPSITGTVTGASKGIQLNGYQYGAVFAGSVVSSTGFSTTAIPSFCSNSGVGGGAPAITACMFSANGAPEGVVTANVGSVYNRRDGAAGSTFYVKSSGTGNTGWLPYTASLLATLTTTAAASDNVTVTGMTASGHCTLFPTNAAAAADALAVFVSAKTVNQITVTHSVVAGNTYDVICTPN